jgi:AcrR family transcriptional regulator
MPTGGPKRRMRAPARRALVLDAALDEFAANGYEGASMGRVGRGADVARTVLYDHFPSKRALFAALLEDKHGELLSHLRATIAADAPTRERMRATVDAYLAYAEREPRAWRLLFPDHAPVDPDAAADHRRLMATSNRLLAELLAPDVRRAGLDPASPVAQAMFVLQQSALLGLVRWWQDHPAVTRAELVEAAVTLLWTGLGGLERAGRTTPL